MCLCIIAVFAQPGKQFLLQKIRFVFCLPQVFYEEELDVPLVLFDEVLDHVLRIDRIFRQPQGHLLLIGVSGSGKTTLSRFVAWMNGLSVYQIKVHNKYTAADFDEDLRIVLRRSGCKVNILSFRVKMVIQIEKVFIHSHWDSLQWTLYNFRCTPLRCIFAEGRMIAIISYSSFMSSSILLKAEWLL